MKHISLAKRLTVSSMWLLGSLAPLFLLTACALPEPPRPLQKASLDAPPAHLDVIHVGEKDDQSRSTPPISGKDRKIFLKGDDLSANLADDPAFKQLRKENRYDQIAFRFVAEKAAGWGIKDPEKEFTLHSIRTDELSMTHVALQQMYRHIPVWNRGVTVHLNPSGQVYLAEGRIIPTPEGLNTVPEIGPGDAMAPVARVLPGDAGCASCQAESVIFISDNGPRMAYRITAAPDLSQRRIYFVDAGTAEILKEQ